MGIKARVRVRGVRGGPFAEKAQIPLERKVLTKLGKCLVAILKQESKDYFAKRGWTGEDPKQGPPIWDSFSFKVVKDDLLIMSSFYGMKELARGNIPERKMTWITQEYKDRNPNRFKLTEGERKLGMKKTGRVLDGEGKTLPPGIRATPENRERLSKRRLPLVVPLKAKTGEIIFKMAPLTTEDAWVHPGIARFTFLENAIRRGRRECARLIAAEMVKSMGGQTP